MPNRYFNNAIDLINNTRARASDVEANFDQLEDAFDSAQVDIDAKATSVDATLTGTPTAPTAAPGTNTSQIATTAFVNAERDNAATLTNKTINLANNTLVATSAQLAAALADETGTGQAVFNISPGLGGTPTAPTAAAGTNTTQLATTAFVGGAIVDERSAVATLTNKTLTDPVISGGSITGTSINGTASISIQRFSGNGVTTSFTLTNNPFSENNTQVYINGVYQNKDTYSVSGTTLTFSEAPHSGTDNIEVASIATQQIGATSSDLVSYSPAGTGAVAATVQGKLREWVSVKDFGAVGDGVTDDTAAIQAAITYANTLTTPKLTVDRGTYLVSSTLSFDLPNYSTIEFLGTIKTATGNPAIRIGSASANRIGYTVTGIKVERLTYDTSSSSVGVEIRNVVASKIDIRRAFGFQDGVLCYADQGNGGVSYNEIHLGVIHDNRYNLHLQTGGSGYVNENIFTGGTYNHSSSYPAVSTVNIWIDYAAYRNNNNRFICPSLEDNSTLGVAAIINGDNNLIIHPRMERSVSQSTYQIQFTVNSRENQIIGAGFVMEPTNIADAAGTNSYETRQNTVIRKQTPAGEGLLRLRSNATSSARAWQVEDSGGTAKAWALGSGDIISVTKGYFETGIRWSTSSGTLNDYGLYVGTGSPEGVVTASPGSLYSNKSGGAGTSFYVKESGSGNTGWVAK